MDYLFLPSNDLLDDFLDCSAVSNMLRPGDRFYILQFPAPPHFFKIASDRGVRFDVPTEYFDGRRLYFYGGFWDVDELLASPQIWGLGKLYRYDHAFLFRPGLTSPNARFYWIGLNHSLASKHVLQSLRTLFNIGSKTGLFLDMEFSASDFAVILVRDADFLGYGDILYYTKGVNRYWLITKPQVESSLLEWLFSHKEPHAHPSNDIKPALDLHALFNARVVVAKEPTLLKRVGLHVQQAPGFWYAVTSHTKYCLV